MIIRAILIDDEINNLENLQSILQSHFPQVQVVAAADSADAGINAIHLHQPALVLLDIQMPEKNGFEVLKAFPQRTFETIFVTAYDQYGIMAIKFSALDYLLKPIDIEELRIAINKVAEKIAAQKKDRSIDNLLDYLDKARREPPRIALPTLQETRYVKVPEIHRCEASNNYTHVYFGQQEQVLVCKTLREFAELLAPYGFIRPHQSHVVNIQAVKSYLKEDGGTILMWDGCRIPVARQHREMVKERLERGA